MSDPIFEKYDGARTCECGALIELVRFGPQPWMYWGHVKRMRIDYDHAAVPVLNLDR